jgi:GntR family transcriptional regulator / MocR family aminotransferase
MPKEIEEIPFLDLQLDSSLSLPLYKQLYESIRKSILSGRLKGGLKLPSTRTLATELKVSRNTVKSAFEQLLNEGYIKGKIGAGTYITDDIPDKLLRVGIDSALSNNNHLKLKLNKELISQTFPPRYLPENDIIPFQPGIPSLEDFPFKTWLKILNKIGNNFPVNYLKHIDATGYKGLKESIAYYLQTYRAVNCIPEQIIIINGSQQGLDLICRLLLNENDNVLLEDPGYFGIREAIRTSNVNILPVPVDSDGMQIDLASETNNDINLIYTTPSHQFPLGTIMSISRRLKLLEFARQNGTWIIEDDYDSEYRYNGNPLPSLQGMDKWNRVIYMGTFSKVLFPGLRLGYLVLPSSQLIDSFANEKSIVDRQSPILEQLVTSKFIEEGHFTRHIRKMRILYKERQEFLIKELNKELGDIIKIDPSAAGMHLIAWLPEYLNDKEISSILRKKNVVAYPLSRTVIKFERKPALILGYTAFNKNQTSAAIKILKETIEPLCK